MVVLRNVGYPLLTVVGHIFWKCFSWTGNPALVLNILSTIFASTAAFFLSATIYYLTNGDEWSAILSTRRLFYAILFSPPFLWRDVLGSVSSIRGIYTQQFICLHYSLPHCTVLLPVLAGRRFQLYFFVSVFRIVFQVARWGAFLAGLSLCNQQTIVFYLFPIIMSVLYILKKTHQLNMSRFFQLAFLFLFGLLPYSYLVITSYFPKKASWGDARTFSGSIRSLSLRRVDEPSPSFGIRYVPSVCWR